MKRAFYSLIFYVFFLIFTNLLFLSCFRAKTEYEKLKKDYNIYITPLNYPFSIREGMPYKIKVRIYLFDQNLNWSLCLASFRSLAYSLSGELCTNKEKEGTDNIYEIDLPKYGYIYLKNPDYIISDYENIIVNFCYNYYSVIGLEGCFYRDKICELKVVSSHPVDGIIRILRAESYYNETDKHFYLRLYLSVEIPEDTFVQSFRPVEKECFIREYIDRFNSKYELRYGNNVYTSEITLKLNVLNQIAIPLKEYNYETEKFYIEIKFYYNIIRRVLLGYTRIEK